MILKRFNHLVIVVMKSVVILCVRRVEKLFTVNPIEQTHGNGTHYITDNGMDKSVAGSSNLIGSGGSSCRQERGHMTTRT